MSFKTDIRKAITNNTRYTAIKVWGKKVEGNPDNLWMLIEVSVRKKKRIKMKK